MKIHILQTILAFLGGLCFGATLSASDNADTDYVIVFSIFTFLTILVVILSFIYE